MKTLIMLSLLKLFSLNGEEFVCVDDGLTTQCYVIYQTVGLIYVEPCLDMEPEVVFSHQ
jgi:hypothetical protein